MEDKEQLGKTYHYIGETFVQRGTAPHYTEIASNFGVKPDEGRKLLHDLIDTHVMPMWLYPGTDLIVSFAPFNNIHLFRSEDHVRSWSGFKPGTEEAILKISDMMAIMSTPRHNAKFSGQYVSHASEYAPLFFQRLREVTKDAAFWRSKT